MTSFDNSMIDLGECRPKPILGSDRIPVLKGCKLELSSSGAPSLRLEPGFIHLGGCSSTSTVRSLVMLRYGIEWQIWRKARPRHGSQVLVDLAAARTTALFANMLSGREKRELESSVDGSFYRILDVLQSDSLNEALESIGDEEFAFLRGFHQGKNDQVVLDQEELDILDYLALPTECLFTRGGDVRLRLDESTQLNVYGCQPYPRPSAFTFASSTATSVSCYGYRMAENQRQHLISRCFGQSAVSCVQSFPAETARKLRGMLGLEELQAQALLCPSGTDAQLICAALIQVVASAPVVNLVVASDETGSGTPLAVSGKHFSSVTALGVAANKGEVLDGMLESGVLNLPIRNASGKLKSIAQMDDEVEKAVDNLLRDGKYPVLHAMDHSKLGCWAPTAECLEHVIRQWGDRVAIVVDACQMRLDLADLHAYLAAGCLVLITGSKFYTGPPFAGAVLIPRQMVEKFRDRKFELADGLRDYVSRHEWPDALPPANVLGDKLNLGASMRWYSALAEMDRFNRVPVDSQLLGIDTFCRAVERILIDTPFLEPLFAADQFERRGDGKVLSGRRTIYPFYIRSAVDGRVLKLAEVRRLYEHLNSDLSTSENVSSEALARVFRQACHIGQPVSVSHRDEQDTAVLRISAGSRIISESWDGRGRSSFAAKVAEEISQIETIVEKIGRIVSRPELLRCA